MPSPDLLDNLSSSNTKHDVISEPGSWCPTPPSRSLIPLPPFPVLPTNFAPQRSSQALLRTGLFECACDPTPPSRHGFFPDVSLLAGKRPLCLPKSDLTRGPAAIKVPGPRVSAQPVNPDPSDDVSAHRVPGDHGANSLSADASYGPGFTSKATEPASTNTKPCHAAFTLDNALAAGLERHAAGDPPSIVENDRIDMATQGHDQFPDRRAMAMRADVGAGRTSV